MTDFELFQTPLQHGTTLIEASAGTGKTYTLTGIFVRFIVEHGLTVSQILVTTYTEAATAELRSRIRSRLREIQDALRSGRTGDPALAGWLETLEAAFARERIDGALRDFDQATIQTIHGFCQRVLRDRAFESHLPFDTELLTDQSLLLREVAEDYWRAYVHRESPAAVAAVLIHRKSAESLAETLEECTRHAELRVLPFPQPQAIARLETALDQFRQQWPAWRDPVRRLFFEANDWANKPFNRPDEMESALALVDHCALYSDAPPDAFKALTGFTTEAIAEGTKAKKTAPSHAFFDCCSEISAAIAACSVDLEVSFIAWARTELATRKARRNVVTFDDLLTRVDAALDPAQGGILIDAVRQRFKAALIDEFQDTDPVQERIFRRLFATPESWLFLIGDPKQAIYGFRGADVFSYLAAAHDADARYRLGTNFRSASALVEAVNAVFLRRPDPFVFSEIEFEPVQAAGHADEKGLVFPDGARPPFHFWLPENNDPMTVGGTEQKIPRMVAAEIARLLNSFTHLGKRRLIPSDVAVLVMTNLQARAIQEALTALRIPSVLVSNASVFASREASELHTVLSALSEPTREGLIRSALTTRLFGLSVIELDELSREERAWEVWLLRFQAWHEALVERGFLPMFRRLLRETEVRPRLLARADGERVLTNILHLAEALHQTAAEQRLSPAALCRWLSTQRQAGLASPEHELRLERDEDAVKVVTVHKSKGLEYGLVFCPYAWKAAELRRDEHPLFHSADRTLTYDLGSPDYEAHEERATVERLAEHTRLLYVALTRARLECHFVWGHFKGQDGSATRRLLHPSSLDLSNLRQEIEGFASQYPGNIAVAPWPEETAAPLDTEANEATTLHPRLFHGQVRRDWRVSSFSGLTEGADTENPDYDRTESPTPTSEVTPIGIHAFPAGKTAGVCLHAILEVLDFTQPDSVPGLVEKTLSAHAFDPREWAPHVSENLEDLLAVEIQPGLSLGQIAPEACLRELEFFFPVDALEPHALSAWLGEEAGGRFTFESLRGILKGFIDLVFEHDGRFYIVDWKSNRLGPETASYHAEALQAEMRRHHYALQYRLYTVALHRFLSLRLPDYDFEEHFGGVFYIFLRGVDPARPELGIHRARPTRETVEAFESRFMP